MNGVSERMIQALNTKARSIKIDGNIPTTFWAEMISTATYLQKRKPTAALEGRSPYKALHKEKPPLQHLRRIGCTAYHRIPDEKFANKTTLKFGTRSTRCMMIGYTESTKIWKQWDPSTARTIRSADVIFIEDENALQKPSTTQATSNCFPERRELEDLENEQRDEIRNEHRDEIRNEQRDEIRNERRKENKRRKETRKENKELAILRGETGEEAIDRLIREIEQETEQRKLEDKRREENEEILRLYIATALSTLAYDIAEPRTFQEALDSPHREEWINGIRNELKSLYINETWDVMPTLADNDNGLAT